MQTPTKQAEASFSTETTVIDNDDCPEWNRAVNVRRKVAKRTRPFELTEVELNLMSTPQDEDIPARKRPRLEEPLPTTTDKAYQQTDSLEVSARISPPTADGDNDDANADSVTDTQPNTGGSNRATRRIWTFEEDAELTRTVTNTPKKIYGKQYKTDWRDISELIPGRSRNQCWRRWHDVLDPSISRPSGRKGKWTAIEDSKLKDAVQTHGDKDWVAIFLLVPGRTKSQCNHRWKDVLDPSKGRASGRKGKWTAIEDSKLKNAVQTLVGDKDWGAVAALVPGRTKKQCSNRWHDFWDPSIILTGGSNGKWTAIEDSKLKDAVQTHGQKDWGVISALVPGRMKKQCWRRWHDTLKPGIDQATGRKGKFSAAEDSQLKHAVQTHGDKDWVAISLLVPGRTNIQCWGRWKYIDPNRRAVREKDLGTLEKAPALGQDPPSP
jgi:hypothetical protein